MRRVRPTPLLRVVVLAVCLASFATVLSLGAGPGTSHTSLVIVAAIWFIGLEAGLLPGLIELFLLRKAAKRKGTTSSIWFVDAQEVARQERARFHRDTEDNPTLR